MKENKFLQPRVSPKQKIALVLFGLFLFFVLLEAGLRLGGFILLSMQEHRNLQSIKQKGTYRILCLGESTTQGQYPQFLEEALNQRNIEVRFSVVDKGRGGTNTSAILSQVEACLAEYHPDMVVTMMGINDNGKHIPFEAVATSKGVLFIRSFRTYKLIRLLWLHILTKAKEVGFYKLNEGRWFSRNLPRIGLKEDYAESISMEDSFKEAIEVNPKNGNACFELGRLYRDQDKFPQAEDAFKKAIELNPKNDDAYVELGWLYQDQYKLSQAEDLLKKAIELNPKNDRAYRSILILYEEIGKPELAKEYAEKTNRLRLGYYNPVTVNNYRKLKEILDRKGIRLVCVQYPMRNVESLKKIFEKDEGIIFVDNENIFKEALKKASYKEYFRNMFGGDFGHCTQKGNQLLAENIANTILREIFGN